MSMSISLPGHIARHWETALAFHGHACPGLAMGCRMAVDAMELLGESGPSADEELVCIAETDACAVDAVQSIMGCTLGKGNLILRMRGKHALSFFARGREAGARLVWKAPLRDLPREERMAVFLTAPPGELYTTTAPPHPVPEKALLSPSLVCTRCGESTAEPYIRLRDGQPFCLDCHNPHSRIIL